MESAPDDCILVSAAIFRSTSLLFNFAPAGSKLFKGLRDEIQLYRLVSARPKSEIAHLRTQPGMHLAGREREISDFVEKFDLLAAGRGGCILLEGEPGIREDPADSTSSKPRPSGGVSRY